MGRYWTSPNHEALLCLTSNVLAFPVASVFRFGAEVAGSSISAVLPSLYF